MAGLMFWWGHFALAAVWCALLMLVARRAPALDGRGGELLSLSSSLDSDGEEASQGERPVYQGPLTPAQDEARRALVGEAIQAAIRRHLYRLMVPKPDREDVAHDVTEAALRSIHVFDPKLGRLERWLNRITVFVAAHFNDKASHRREELTDEPPEGDDAAPGADVLCEAEGELRARHDALLAALRDLPDDVRDVVRSHDLEGEPMQSIAERLGAPLSTVYKWRARGIAPLVKALRPAGG